MPKVPKEELKKEGKAEIAPRSKSSMFRTFKDRTQKTFVSFALAAALAACSPATVNAKDTTPAKGGKPVAAAVEKGKKEVKYEVFSDPKELEPYFKNAEGKLVKFQPNETKELGEYIITAQVIGDSVTDFLVKSKDGSYEEYGGIPYNISLDKINVLVVDMGNNHPMIRGKMIVFADSARVEFVFFDKMLGKHSIAVVDLYEGEMRPGPINTGYGIDGGGVFVINAPKNLKPGDVVCQAILRNNGDSGPYWYQYEGPTIASETKTVSLLERK